MVARHFVCEMPEAIHRAVCSLSFPARIRIRDEGAVKERVQLAVERVVQKPVAHARLVYIARLRVGDFEMLVAAMRVRASRKVAMKREDIVHQSVLKLLHIFLLPFSAYELFPRGKQIFNRNDILV